VSRHLGAIYREEYDAEPYDDGLAAGTSE
jgi:hypothetical protein